MRFFLEDKREQIQNSMKETCGNENTIKIILSQQKLINEQRIKFVFL